MLLWYRRRELPPTSRPLVVHRSVTSGAHRYVHVVGAAVWIDERPADGAWGAHFIGLVDGEAWWGVDVPVDDDPSDGASVDLRAFYGRSPEHHWLAAGRAVQIVEWARTHRFCGRCGEATEVRGGGAGDALPAMRAALVPAPGAGDDHARHQG